jgi:hypothetical protein
MPNEKKVNNGMREWVRDFIEATCVNPVDGHLRKNHGAFSGLYLYKFEAHCLSAAMTLFWA